MRKTRAKLYGSSDRRKFFYDGELGIIRRIRERAARTNSRVSLAIGDDCALLSLRSREEAAVTTDLSIDGRHFRLEWHPPDAIGHRTLARGLSDLAAMGARPVAAFLSLGLPRDLVRNGNTWPDRFLDGLLALADVHGAVLAGGDLAQSPVAMADIVMVGAVPLGGALLRSGARPEDQLFVTGALGGAAAALERLAQWGAGKKPVRRKISSKFSAELGAHLYPQPRVKQGLWLQHNKAATAAIDISDGLSTDLAHLCDESSVAAEIDAALLPIHAGATLEQALHGGEDYELLFTARENARIPRVIAGVAVTRIGRIVKRRAGQLQISLIDGSKRQAIKPRGWQHFS